MSLEWVERFGAWRYDRGALRLVVREHAFYPAPWAAYLYHTVTTPWVIISASFDWAERANAMTDGERLLNDYLEILAAADYRRVTGMSSLHPFARRRAIS